MVLILSHKLRISFKMFAPFRSAVTFKNTDVSKFPSQIKFQGKRSETLRVARQKHRRHFQIPQRLNPAGMKTISSSSSIKFFFFNPISQRAALNSRICDRNIFIKSRLITRGAANRADASGSHGSYDALSINFGEVVWVLGFGSSFLPFVAAA